MVQLSYRQVVGVCDRVGIPKLRYPTMTAICAAESGRRTDAYNPEGSYGLWQIHKPAWGHLFDDFKWYDAIDNGRMMKHVLNRQGLTAWSVYNSGSYLKYYAAAVAAAGFPDPNIPSGGTPPGRLHPPPKAGADDYSGWINATRGQFNTIYRLANTRATQLNRIRWRRR